MTLDDSIYNTFMGHYIYSFSPTFNLPPVFKEVLDRVCKVKGNVFKYKQWIINEAIFFFLNLSHNWCLKNGYAWFH